jgi:hypothetical protein
MPHPGEDDVRLTENFYQLSCTMCLWEFLKIVFEISFDF